MSIFVKCRLSEGSLPVGINASSAYVFCLDIYGRTGKSKKRKKRRSLEKSLPVEGRFWDYDVNTSIAGIELMINSGRFEFGGDQYLSIRCCNKYNELLATFDVLDEFNPTVGIREYQTRNDSKDANEAGKSSGVAKIAEANDSKTAVCLSIEKIEKDGVNRNAEEDDVRLMTGISFSGETGEDAMRNEALIDIIFHLRHDARSNHWSGVESPRFSDLKYRLRQFAAASAYANADAAEVAMLCEILDEADATIKTLEHVGTQAFADWLRDVVLGNDGIMPKRFRERYKFRVRVVNDFPLLTSRRLPLEGWKKIKAVGRGFREAESFVQTAKNDNCKRVWRAILQFRKEIEIVANAKSKGVMADAEELFVQCLRQNDIPDAAIPEFNFIATKEEETKGDDLFRYVSLELRPGNMTSIRLATKKNVILKSVCIHAGEKQLLKWEWKQVLTIPEATDSVLDCLDIYCRLGDYQLVFADNSGIKVSIEVEGESSPRIIKKDTSNDKSSFFNVVMDDSFRANENNRVALFVDMGSTYTKLIAAPVDARGFILERQISAEHRIYEETGAFLSKRGLWGAVQTAMGEKKEECKECGGNLVAFKGRMTEDPSGAKYAQFIIDAIKILGTRYRMDKGLILDAVYWSFPLKRNGDGKGNSGSCRDRWFESVQQSVRKGITGHVMKDSDNSFYLYPEHEALRHMFDFAIQGIAEYIRQVGRKFKQRKLEIERQRVNTIKSDTMALKSFWHCLYNSDAKAHNERVRSDANSKAAKEIQSEKNKLATDELLKAGLVFERYVKAEGISVNVAYIDAGGFSLDSVVRFGEEDMVSLTRSFEAGGEALIDKTCDWLLAKRQTQPKREDVARGIKRGVYNNDKDKEEFQKVMFENYKIYIDGFNKHVCVNSDNDIVKLKKRRLWFLVVSGGVSRNVAFQNLFQARLMKDEDLKLDVSNQDLWPNDWKTPGYSVPTPILSSRLIYGLIVDIEQRAGCANLDEKLALFKRLVEKSKIKGEESMDRAEMRFPRWWRFVSPISQSLESSTEDFDIVGGMLQDAVWNKQRQNR